MVDSHCKERFLLESRMLLSSSFEQETRLSESDARQMSFFGDETSQNWN